MLDSINKRIEQLSIEAQGLANKRIELHASLDECDVRLTQIIGALNELESLKRDILETKDGQG